MSECESGNNGILSSIRPLLSGSAVLPWWLRTMVVLGSLLMATGALIALFHPVLLVSPHDEINEAVHIYAGYLASRNLGLAVMLLAAMSLRATGMLNSLMLLTALIQVLDAGIDCVEGRWAIVPGVVVFAVIFFVGSARLSGYPFWRIEAWRQGH
jgi:hypothetical protein